MDEIQSPLAPRHIIYRRRPPISKYLLLFLILAAVVNATIAGFVYYKNVLTAKPHERVMCTADAKICSDGSSVARTPPKCEFAPCPPTTVTFSPTDETASWKVYTNPKYNYEIRYPSSWLIREAIVSPSIPPDQINYEAKLEDNEFQKVTFGTKNSVSCVLKILKNPQKLTYDQWVKQYKYLSTTDVNLIDKIENSTFSAYPGKLVSISLIDHNDYVIVTDYGGNIFFYQYSLTEGNQNYSSEEQKSEKICKLILSTFKFLDSTSPTSSLLYK